MKKNNGKKINNVSMSRDNSEEHKPKNEVIMLDEGVSKAIKQMKIWYADCSPYLSEEYYEELKRYLCGLYSASHVFESYRELNSIANQHIQAYLGKLCKENKDDIGLELQLMDKFSSVVFNAMKLLKFPFEEYQAHHEDILMYAIENYDGKSSFEHEIVETAKYYKKNGSLPPIKSVTTEQLPVDATSTPRLSIVESDAANTLKEQLTAEQKNESECEDTLVKTSNCREKVPESVRLFATLYKASFTLEEIGRLLRMDKAQVLEKYQEYLSILKKETDSNSEKIMIKKSSS